ncbi:beta-thymosin 3-like protein [Leptotrombidium deliense]|uniref:Beta-thymosin 3-like protein n=1 Tax=Leptotrombidium deliense TaxID=299467 RepID=A0A443SA56_9ACAR|nr:beta-thymosin 3-like protein [Leptotrombidium deliense]
MSDCKKEELPKIESDLKKEIECSKIDLNPVQTEVKDVKPTQEQIAEEKQHVELLTKIEGFDADKLKNVTPEVKDHLPTQQEIEAEKNAKN